MNAVRTWEQAVLFGEQQHLVGLYRKPKFVSAFGDTAVIMLTAGMLPSSGPFRLHVDLARALGRTGLHSLRFDLSGIGESLAVGTGGTSLERASSEVSAAINYLEEEHRIRRFALFGLCSGADDAIFAALNDRRIASVFALDGLGYRTRRFRLHRLRTHYAPKLFSPSKWLQVGGAALGRRTATPESLQLATDIREFPARDVATKQLQELLARGVRMHFHYTGGVNQYYSYEKQFEDMFPELYNSLHADQPQLIPLLGRGRTANGRERAHAMLSYSFNPVSDHVGFLCEHRADIVKRVCRKLIEFAKAPPRSVAQ